MQTITRKELEQLHELAENHISLVDVWGGKMWYNDETGKYTWDLNELIQGFSNLNRLAICYGN